MFNQRLGPTSTSLDSSESYQLPSKTQSGDISWYQPDPPDPPRSGSRRRRRPFGLRTAHHAVAFTRCWRQRRGQPRVHHGSPLSWHRRRAYACLGEYALNARRRRRATEELATHLGKRGEPFRAATCRVSLQIVVARLPPCERTSTHPCSPPAAAQGTSRGRPPSHSPVRRWWQVQQSQAGRAGWRRRSLTHRPWPQRWRWRW